MNTDEYVEQALRTESQGYPLNINMRLLHASLGMQTEAAEFADMLKKHIFYNKPLDTVNLKEELGDMLWYVAIAIDELETSLGAEMKRNIAKLRVRFPSKYDDVAADQRDLFAEREVLEK